MLTVRSWPPSQRIRTTAAVMMLLSIALAGPTKLPAQTDQSAQPTQTTANKVTPASFDVIPQAVVELSKIPLAFSKGVPESIDDLREMEAHLQGLIPRLKQSTVALTVGNAQGSGVIVSDDGYILTAAHVSGRPNHRVSITLADGTQVTGRSLGRNQTLDASLIKIDSPQQTWPYSPMADFKDIGVGDWCATLGHPGGYQADRDPVLRLGRVIHVDEEVIQTDNELVGGDSGGPLFDMYGRVIGINSRIGPSTTFNLHAPICAYADDWDRLVAGEDFILHSGALLGVRAEPDERGLRLTKVWPENPAGRAGLREGDILLRFQSHPVHSIEQLSRLVGEHQPGERVVLSVLRDGEVQEFPVRLGSRNATEEE
jgi:serine protease Do